MYMIQPVDVEDLLTRCCNCVSTLCYFQEGCMHSQSRVLNLTSWCTNAKYVFSLLASFF